MNDVETLLKRLEGRGQKETARFRNRIFQYLGASSECHGRNALDEKGSGVFSGFAGEKPRALHRTRTGDPFLTMPNAPKGVKRRIVNVCMGFLLIVGLLILTLFGGSDAF
jgi:hypothetical protein